MWYVLIMAVLLNACTFNEDINKDPNNPTNAPLNALLSPSEILIAYTWGGNYSRYNGMFTQQLFGFDRQAATIYNYQFKRSDTDDPWDNLYRAMLNNKDIIDRASTTSPHYSGVAKVLMAYSLGSLTSMYGDIPYSEALKGADNSTQPKYDSQESIYNQIQALLDQAIVDFGTENNGLAPSTDDIIYSGDIPSWKALAFALKARYHLHTAKVRPTAYNSAIASVDSAIANGFVDFKLTFDGASATTEAPWYQWNDQRGDIIPNEYMFGLMDTIADPRLSTFFDVTTAGGFGEAFGTYLQGATGPVLMMSRYELYYILAECYFALGDEANAASNLKLAVEASYSDVGTTGTYTPPTPLDLKTIMLQKYFAFYLNPECFVDWRRTGFPEIVPVDGVAVPRKYPYPTKEKNYNGGNTPDEGTQPYLKRMWIDP